jgi:hypothetical protein
MEHDRARLAFDAGILTEFGDVVQCAIELFPPNPSDGIQVEFHQNSTFAIAARACLAC